MPLYEYRCESCEHQFEVIQKFSDPHVSVCPQCGGGPVVKLISSPAFTFKGTGFYITDYARKDQGERPIRARPIRPRPIRPRPTGRRAPPRTSPTKSDKSAASKPAASDTASTPSTTTTPKAD